MLISGTSTSPQIAEGVVHSIDLIGRTVTVLLPLGMVTIDVPPACEIWLNGERVKLRLLQPQDRTRVTFYRKCGVLTAMAIHTTTRYVCNKE